jgi:hypothetical protein
VGRAKSQLLSPQAATQCLFATTFGIPAPAIFSRPPIQPEDNPARQFRAPPLIAVEVTTAGNQPAPVSFFTARPRTAKESFSKSFPDAAMLLRFKTLLFTVF